MLAKLFKNRRKDATRNPSVPQGQRIYAIGDIHGRADLLDVLIEQIDVDNRQRGSAETLLIFLGDLVDRGACSAEVVERLLRMDASSGKVRFLMGNHEEVFLKAMRGDLSALKFFHRIGGRETLLSYGITPEEYAACDWAELAELARGRVPQTHLDFMERFEDIIVVGDYAFVHAGIRPDVPLRSQRGKDLRWIRDDFLDHRDSYGHVIVHGHSIRDDVEWRTNRIGIDTGAYASGKLTALALEGEGRWLLQT